MTTSSRVSQLYKTVVDDVINNVKDAFLDEGVDEQVLQELKQLWENKLSATKALEPAPEPEVRPTNPAVGLLLQNPSLSTQQIHQGYVPQRVLAAAPQQPGRTFPVSLTTNRPDLTTAATQATMALPVGLLQQQLAALGAAGQGNVTFQATANGQYIAVQNIGGQQATIAIPQQALIAQGALQAQHVAGVSQVSQVTTTPVTQNRQNQSGLIQLDGTGDGSSSSDDDDFENDDNDDDNEDEQNEEDEQGEEEEPLNSNDDVSEDDPTDLFDTDNVVVCQYDKINRNKNKWKFNLKDGIMNVNGKDFVFQRANGTQNASCRKLVDRMRESKG